jgi:serine/threonine protein kinase
MKALAVDDPRVIGGYRLRAQLGSGGMGRVYLGLSPGGRAVAIKVVHPDLARDTEFLRRFGQEVAAARAVSGIYTAPVVASGLNEHPPWLATAFVPGPSLDQVVTEHGPLPEQALWPLLAGLVEALQAIHACKVVHRDLKPANVLLATDGPRVIDFGISRAADGTALTVAGVVFGTPGYMSPEQAEGKAAGPASDVFALGCVLAYAATGAGPFGSGTAAAVLYRVVYGEPALDAIPPELREVVSACLAKDPDARPALRTLATAIAGGGHATGPSAVAFWPRSVAGIIGAYQARIERETSASGQAAEAQGFSWAAAVHPPTTPSDPGSSKAPQWPPQQPAQPSPDPGSRWPYAGPGSHSGFGGAGAGGAAGAAGSAGGGDPPGNVGLQASSGPEDFAPSQAYSSPQSHPQPQGYGGAQPSRASQASQAQPAPPRGYLPVDGGPAGYSGPAANGGPPASGGPPGGGGSMGYAQPYQLGSRGPIYQLPGTMVTAVRLMYAGAVYTLIYAIGLAMVVRSALDHPAVGTAAHTGLGAVAGLVVLVSLIEIAVWLWIARACGNGRSWARVTGTVLFAIHTLSTIALLGNSRPDIGLAKLLDVIGWLIACGAVVFLWRRPSSAFFSSRASSR